MNEVRDITVEMVSTVEGLIKSTRVVLKKVEADTRKKVDILRCFDDTNAGVLG